MESTAELYYMRNRWYEPRTGRFLCEDPIGIAGGLNLYAYADNNPIGGRDPSGLSSCRYESGRDGSRTAICTYTVQDCIVQGTSHDACNGWQFGDACYRIGGTLWGPNCTVVTALPGQSGEQGAAGGGRAPQNPPRQLAGLPEPSFSKCMANAMATARNLASSITVSNVVGYAGRGVQRLAQGASSRGASLVDAFRFGTRPTWGSGVLEEGMVIMENARWVEGVGATLEFGGVGIGGLAFGYTAGAALACATDHTYYGR